MSKTTKATFYIKEETARALRIESAKSGDSQSQLVNDWVWEGLEKRGYTKEEKEMERYFHAAGEAGSFLYAEYEDGESIVLDSVSDKGAAEKIASAELRGERLAECPAGTQEELDLYCEYGEMVPVPQARAYRYLDEQAEELGWEGLCERIVGLAFSSWSEGTADGVVAFNYESGELEGHQFVGNTYWHPDYPAVEIYRLGANWVGGNPWDDHRHILSDEEFSELQEKLGDDESVNVVDADQLALIGIDLDERLKGYLVWCLDEAGGLKDIMEELLRG